MSNPVGQVLLGQFRVDSFVAAGGMGSVYKAWDLKRNVYLAMKVLHAELSDDPGVFKRFQREARALERLAHPNIVPFYGLHKTGEFAFLLERFIDGPSLKEILKKRQGKPLPAGEALYYMKALCAALGFAHANRVVHCDVKPGNLMVDAGGSLYLTDFGVARHADSTSTTAGMAGTAAYMAPEQVLGGAVSPASDIYALGVTLFELLAGRRPFRGNEAGTESGGQTANERITWAQLHLAPPDLHALNPEVPEALAEVVLRALAKDPAQRYQSTQALYAAACAAAGVNPEDPAGAFIPAGAGTEEPVGRPGTGGGTVRSAPAPDSWVKRLLRNPLFYAAAFLIVAVTVGAAIFWPKPDPVETPAPGGAGVGETAVAAAEGTAISIAVTPKSPDGAEANEAPTEEPAAATSPAALAPVNWGADDPWVEQTLGSMSTEEKVGQLLVVAQVGQTVTPAFCQLIRRYRLGGVLFEKDGIQLKSLEEAQGVTSGLQACSPELPLFTAIDQEGEFFVAYSRDATVFPAALAIGATGDPEYSYQAARAVGQELAYSGLNMILGPVADVMADPSSKILGLRSFGDDPQQVAQFVERAVAGYLEGGVIPVLKHFPNHGGVFADSTEELPVDAIDRAGLDSRYLPPYRSGLQAGAPGVMVSHVAFPAISGRSIPASRSPEALGLLRDELGFAGLTVSDSMNAVAAQAGTSGIAEASLEAVAAGTDLLLFLSSGDIPAVYDRLRQAAQRGELPPERLDEAVRHILQVKAAFGLKAFPLASYPAPDWAQDEQLAIEIGQRAVTVMKDEQGLIPLPESARNVLIIGPEVEAEAQDRIYTRMQTALTQSGRTARSEYYPPPAGKKGVQDNGLASRVLSEAGNYDAVIVITCQSHTYSLSQAQDRWQINLVKDLNQRGTPLVVIAMRNPTDILDFPGIPTYLATFGNTDGQWSTLIAALVGEAEAVGVNPLPNMGVGP